MSRMDGERRLKLPVSLQEAIKRGTLTQGQLRKLITLEAEALGLSFEEAVEEARKGTLSRNSYLGADLELLVELLPV